ncbi:unnamed protein product [Rhizoctonia solani]|uniref:F-box domain-containing protein n=1 Tax=Rhizoctonia solani TaxID=456999 RepID=A0A8H3HZ71_9AGAM|nr:unnamed protein product [Rhizoctonia solani]
MDKEFSGAQPATPVQQWRAARAQLAAAIHAFSAISAAISPSDFGIASPTLDLDPSLDKLDIEEELRALGAEAKKLDDACTLLKVQRNGSWQMVPINRLSEDILIRIFATVIAWDDLSCETIVDTVTGRKKSGSVFVLSSVSVAWRYIVTNTSSFWTHLDVNVSSTTYFFPKRTELYLERIKDAPADLHVTSTVYNDGLPIAHTIPEFLTYRTVTSLFIESFNQVHAEALVEAWLNSSHAYQLHSLRVIVIRAPYASRSTHLIDISGLPHISTLRFSGIGINGTGMSWNKATGLTGFTDLDLSDLDIDSSPSMEQLQVILLSNPELRILRLSKIESYVPIESYHTTPQITINLPRLQFLGIGRLPWYSITVLLRIITPGPEFTCLNIGYPGFADEGLDLLEAFCSRHKVQILSLDIPIHHEQNLAIFVRSLKGLHTLNLSNLSLDTNALPDILSDRSECIDTDATTNDFPHIQMLRFSKCTILASVLKRMVVTHPIRWLRLDSCAVFESRREFTTLWGNHPPATVPGPLVDWLSSEVQELHIGNANNQASRGLPWWLQPV